MFSSRFTQSDRENIQSASKKNRASVIFSIKTRRESAERELPGVIEIQKMKLSIVISKTPDETVDFDKLSEEYKVYVPFIIKFLAEQVEGFRFSHKTWNDAEAIDVVKATLNKHTEFKLSTYLKCAKFICTAFAQKCNTSNSTILNTVIEYALTHARQFGDPTKHIFLNDNKENSSADSSQQGASQAPPCSSVEDQAEQLVNELEEAYNSNKFQTLNKLVTSFALIILRRSLKQPLNRLKGDLLPKLDTSNIRNNACLLIQAYLNTDDEKTKKNLQNTCLKYMQWYDMHLPYLFEKVLDLYDITVDKLWDALASTQRKEVILSLINFATEYYENYKLSKNNPQLWLCYSRFINCSHNIGLSNKQNAMICIILNCLVEMKDEHAIKINTWTDQSDHDLIWAQGQARDMYWNLFK